MRGMLPIFCQAARQTLHSRKSSAQRLFSTKQSMANIALASAFDQRRIAPHNLKYEKHILPHERRRGIDSFELGSKRVPGPLNRVPGNSQEPDDLNGWKRSEMPTFEMLLKLGSLLRVKEKITPAAKASERWYLAATEIPLCVSRTVRPFL